MSAPVEQVVWSRLDRRMLLIHPVTELVRTLPVIAVSVILGAQSGNHVWGLALTVLVVVAALLRWFTTSYRIGSDDVQLRTGLFQKKVLSIPRGRIRSVDVRAGPLHRVLGLAVLTVGTGRQTTDRSEKFELNALDASVVPALRESLLSGTDTPVGEQAPGATTREQDIAHFRTGWVRFAPFTGTGIVVVGAAVGLVFQSGAGNAIIRSSVVDDTYDSIVELGVAVAVIVAAAALVVVSTLISVVRYVLVYGNLSVTDDGSRIRVAHGLVSTRHTTLDRDRLRGASLRRPLLLRSVRGARLDAVMSGVSASEKESSLLVPPAPLAAAVSTMTEVLGAPYATTPLRSHGPAALRRRLTRAVVPVCAVVAAAVAWRVAGNPVPTWAWIALAVALVVAAALAVDRYRALGHHAAPGVLITEHGSLDRRRVAVDTDGVVAWGVRQTFFQRRSGVATAIAATAAGTGHYDVIDVPETDVWSMIDAAKPGSGDVWTRSA